MKMTRLQVPSELVMVERLPRVFALGGVSWLLVHFGMLVRGGWQVCEELGDVVVGDEAGGTNGRFAVGIDMIWICSVLAEQRDHFTFALRIEDRRPKRSVPVSIDRIDAGSVA